MNKMHFQMDILINGMLVDELSTIVHTSRLEYNARRLTEKLKEMIPRQMVQVIILRELLKFPTLCEPYLNENVFLCRSPFKLLLGEKFSLEKPSKRTEKM